MKFYHIQEDYLDYLRGIDPRVMLMQDIYNKDKFVFGSILNINNVDYYAPISSIKEKQKEIDINGNEILTKKYRRKVIPILDNDFLILATIRIDYMFPVEKKYLIPLKIDEISRTSLEEYSYFSLVQKEYLFCKKNIDEITKKAKKLYFNAINPTHFFNKLCCDFKLLEKEYLNFKKKH